MIVEKVHDIISLKQKPWLKLYIGFNTNKGTVSNNDIDKDLPKSMNCSFCGRTTENDKNCMGVKLIQKNDDDKLMKLQSKKSYDKYDSYTFKQNEILMYKPKHLGFVVGFIEVTNV